MFSKFLLFITFLSLSTALEVDNGVEGDPEIDCGPQSITVNFNTRSDFEGHVFVKGLYKDASCRNDQNTGRTAGITLPFGGCNAIRTRSLNPRGVFVGATVVISFHPQFITKVDRAYRVQCFYMEADKTVSNDIEVSMLTTSFHTQVVPMPICTYQILEATAQGGAGSTELQFVTVGQKVYHKWTCESPATDTFCMAVHSCYVDDGAGDRVDLLDTSGCAQDKYLLGNLQYMTDLMAGQETHVFKYADRPQLFFQCQISLTIKEPGQECPRPVCPEPSRGKRFAPRSAPVYRDPANTVDVVAIVDSFSVDQSRPVSLNDDVSVEPYNAGKRAGKFCLNTVGLGILAAVTVVTFVVTIFACTMIRRR